MLALTETVTSRGREADLVGNPLANWTSVSRCFELAASRRSGRCPVPLRKPTTCRVAASDEVQLQGAHPATQSVSLPSHWNRRRRRLTAER